MKSAMFLQKTKVVGTCQMAWGCLVVLPPLIEILFACINALFTENIDVALVNK
ncbi:MAG: hypothetical protein ABII99_00865 [Patescibacteria group bacterium]